MLFNSHIFIFVFMPLALLAYYQLGRINHRAAGLSLVVSSLIFYAWWNPPFALILMGSIAFNYSISHWITRNEGFDGRQSAILALGITVDLAALFYYKYLFALMGFLDTIGVASLNVHPILLPLGISFYTFTQIGYLIDCRQGMAKDRGFFDYCLFVTFFPHLIAGPLVHHAEMIPQFKRGRTGRSSVLAARGFAIFVAGLFKKVVIADNLTVTSLRREKDDVTEVREGFECGIGVGYQDLKIDDIIETFEMREKPRA